MGIRDDLTPLESGLVECAAAGDVLDCAPTGPTIAELDQIDDWEERKIRAEVLVALCTGEEPDWSVHPRRGLSLRGAYIAGRVDLSRAQMTSCPLDFHLCRFEEDVVLYQAATADLSFTSCDLLSLNGDELNSSGSLYLTETHLYGMSLLGAVLSGDLQCDEGTELINPGDVALGADRMSASGVLLRGLYVEGTVRLLGAILSGDLQCDEGTKLTKPGDVVSGDVTLNAGRMSASDVFLRGLHVEGEVRLSGADIAGSLECGEGTKLINPGGDALNAEACKVGGALFFSLGKTAVGRVNLAYAQVGILADDLDSWPNTHTLVGFSYHSLLGGDENLDENLHRRRLRWIGNSKPFSPNVYSQLAEVYRRSGHEGFARQVAIEREKERAQQPDLNWWVRAWNRFLGLTVAYGYQPWRALVPLMVLFALGWFIFSLPPAQEAMVNIKGPTSAAACHELYPCFSPPIYVLDTLLPIVDLHQESNWVPARPRPWGVWYEVLTWVLIASGWILTTAIVAGIGSLWRRE